MPDELEALKDELNEACAQFELIGGKISEKDDELINKLRATGTAVELKVAIDHFKREKAKLEKKR